MKKTFLIIAAITAFIACEKDEKKVTNPGNGEEEELITTVRLIFNYDTVSLPADTFTFKDIDGAGGLEPTVFDTIKLVTSENYTVQVAFLNESRAEAEDITEEILAEAEEHIICYSSSEDDLLITRTDSDGNYEVGLESSWSSTEASIGTVTMTLKHQPDVKDGTCAPGETDVEVVFPFIVQ